MTYAAWIVGSYLIGSVQFGDFVARLAHKDIRLLGTGNPGTANVFRELGLRYAVLVLILDLTKGAIPTGLIMWMNGSSWINLAVSFAVIIGHMIPVFSRFNGGTGLVVGMGVTLGLSPLAALLSIPLNLVIAKMTHNMGYVGMTFFAIAVIAGWLIYSDLLLTFTVLLIGLVIYFKTGVQYGDWFLGIDGTNLQKNE